MSFFPYHKNYLKLKLPSCTGANMTCQGQYVFIHVLDHAHSIYTGSETLPRRAVSSGITKQRRDGEMAYSTRHKYVNYGTFF